MKENIYKFLNYIKIFYYNYHFFLKKNIFEVGIIIHSLNNFKIAFTNHQNSKTRKKEYSKDIETIQIS